MYNGNSVVFGCTALKGTNKKGTLKCDADGYYQVVLGAFDAFNSAGAFYPLAPAKRILHNSSSFQRRISGGNLRGECGHPRRQPGNSERDFKMRILDIYEPNISHHIRKVWLEEGHRDEKGRNIVLAIGEVKPTGPRGSALKQALDNPHEDVCFSIRSFTNDVPVRGIWYKNLKQIVTWDWVNEPGISAAHKWNAPALESFVDSEMLLSREEVLAMAEEEELVGVGAESGQPSMRSLVEVMGWKDSTPFRPPSDYW